MSENKKNSKHTCQAVVVSCMDFRLGKYLQDFCNKNIKNGYDRVSVAGGVKNLPFILAQISISIQLHHSTEAWLINHEDCGAYGAEGNYPKHKKDLILAENKLKELFPTLKIFLYYLKLDGEFVKVGYR